MEFTNYHAKYYAHVLSQKSAEIGFEKLANVLFDAQVDLNPHQIESALFAINNPLATGKIIADEVGLGKTISTGIVISQKWAENKRKILIIVPANLRMQWQQELSEKFDLESIIIDGNVFAICIKNGLSNPFMQDEIVITSYNFASTKADLIKEIGFDLVVLDEAHRLRNVYKTDNIIANNIQNATRGCFKLLLTATPLQNSLLELYGLVSFVDDYVFGDLESFKQQFLYMKNSDNSAFDDLTQRLKSVCIRTLRRQVVEYINYTKRLPITQEFTPTKNEQLLYDKVSDYLQKDKLWALPSSQRYLISLILWKQLASSTVAISSTLNKLITRLQLMLEQEKLLDLTGLDESLILKEYEYITENVAQKKSKLTDTNKQEIEKEILQLQSFYDLAKSIKENAKGNALILSLDKGFSKLKQLKAPLKAVVFTESRKTQQYLFELLEDTKYKNKVCLFHGSLNTPEKRQQVINEFKGDCQIMIATEAAAEGLNLQFCSMIINYDLPWNPQRIEQRIGRCHRYGQKFDVVVINFLNKNNIADQRVYELLCNKFQLFEGVFGASDSVLGNMDSLDFEKRIINIYQKCRTTAEIENSFEELKILYKESIDENVKDIKFKLLENFDEEVTEKLRLNASDSRYYLNRLEQMLWELSKDYLKSFATFIEKDDKKSFILNNNPFKDMKVNVTRQAYHFDKNALKSQRYRLNSPIATNMIFDIKYNYNLPIGQVTFNVSEHKPKISILESLINKKGCMSFHKISVNGIQNQEFFIFCGFDYYGEKLDDEQCRRLWGVSGNAQNYKYHIDDYKKQLKTNEITREYYNDLIEQLGQNIKSEYLEKLSDLFLAEKENLYEKISETNAIYFDEEMDKLEKWAKDVKLTMERNIKNIDVQINELKVNVRKASKLEAKLELQSKIKDLESKRNQQRYDLYAEQDKIDDEKELVIDKTKQRLKNEVKEECVFIIEWKVT